MRTDPLFLLLPLSQGSSVLPFSYFISCITSLDFLFFFAISHLLHALIGDNVLGQCGG